MVVGSLLPSHNSAVTMSATPRQSAPMFVIGNVAGKGRGLVADKPIQRGTTILRDAAIRLAEGDREQLNKTVMRTHYHFYKTEQAMEF